MRSSFSIIFSLLLIVSCQQELVVEDMLFKPQRINRIVMSAEKTGYDDIATRVGFSGWEDKDSLFLYFETEKKNAVCVYDASTKTWTLDDEALTLPQCENQRVKGYYMGKGLTIKDSDVQLSAFTPVYDDSFGRYTVTADGSLKIVLELTPLYGRLRFKGKAGTEVADISGILSPHTFNIKRGEIYLENAPTNLNVSNNGSTAYLYGRLDDSKREICVKTDNLYTMTCASKVLSPHQSGWLNIPTKTNHSGWKMYDVLFVVEDVPFAMIRVEGGTFTMGATPEQGSDAESDEMPAHKVTLSNYYIGETEVTQALWKAVMGSNPSDFKGNNLPVEQVSWNDCQTFIKKLNTLTGKKFRLPTEAEWEYAARGGNKSKGYKYSGSNNLGDIAWYKDNSNNKTHPVKTKQPNELGIFDMSGNVMEWCQDLYSSSYYYSSPSNNPKGPNIGDDRVFRGSSYVDMLRVSRRRRALPGYSSRYLGLRLVRSE